MKRPPGSLLIGMANTRQGLLLSWEQPPGGSTAPPPADLLISIPAALTCSPGQAALFWPSISPQALDLDEPNQRYGLQSSLLDLSGE